MIFEVKSKYDIGYKFNARYRDKTMKAEVVLVELQDEGDEIYRMRYLAEMENKERRWLTTFSMEDEQ